MADRSYIQSVLGGVPQEIKRALTYIFDYVLRNLRLGRPGAAVASENFAAQFYEVTTPSTPNAEFVIAHRFNDAPYLLVPVVSLNTVNATTVDLTVTRPADGAYVYLKSSVASATVVVLIEG